MIELWIKMFLWVMRSVYGTIRYVETFTEEEIIYVVFSFNREGIQEKSLEGVEWNTLNYGEKDFAIVDNNLIIRGHQDSVWTRGNGVDIADQLFSVLFHMGK